MKTKPTTTAAARVAASKAVLVASGGRRVSVNLDRDTVAILDRLCDSGNLTQTQAIDGAIHLAGNRFLRKNGAKS